MAGVSKGSLVAGRVTEGGKKELSSCFDIPGVRPDGVGCRNGRCEVLACKSGFNLVHLEFDLVASCWKSGDSSSHQLT